MLFNTFEFIIFFSSVFLIYWRLPRLGQNVLLLVASYVFYGLWSWKFLLLLFSCSLVSYFSADRIAAATQPNLRRLWLLVGIVFHLGVLIVFKYNNFFLENFYNLLGVFGVSIHKSFLNIVLPVGLSFYTFQAMSYVIDVFRRTMKPQGNFFDYMVYLSFFPQLVAGPIGRAPVLLPQFLKVRQWEKTRVREGLYLVFWGSFQKIFVADNLARLVQPVFTDPTHYHGSGILVALYAFTIQLYCDFAGYSNIARGLAAMLGFELMANFNLPLWTTNVQDFWNKWHISLSFWVRDYLYFPLMGALRGIKGNLRVYAAILISMTLLGVWHGAAWNFVAFGLYYGLLLVGLILVRMYCAKWIAIPSARGVQTVWFWMRVIFMFNLTSSAMLLFHASSLNNAAEMLCRLFTFNGQNSVVWESWAKLIGFSVPILVMEYVELKTSDPFFVLNKIPWLGRIALLSFMAYLMFGFGVMKTEEFIYFQF